MLYLLSLLNCKKCFVIRVTVNTPRKQILLIFYSSLLMNGAVCCSRGLILGHWNKVPDYSRLDSVRDTTIWKIPVWSLQLLEDIFSNNNHASHRKKFFFSLFERH